MADEEKKVEVVQFDGLMYRFDELTEDDKDNINQLTFMADATEMVMSFASTAKAICELSKAPQRELRDALKNELKEKEFRTERQQ